MAAESAPMASLPEETQEQRLGRLKALPPDEAKRQIEGLEAKALELGLDPGHRDWPDLELTALHQAAHNERPPAPAAPSSLATTRAQLGLPGVGTISVEAAPEVLDTVAGAIEALARSALAPAAPRPRELAGSHPAAQALLAGTLLGLGDKYQDSAMQAAGAELAAKAAGAWPGSPLTFKEPQRALPTSLGPARPKPQRSKKGRGRKRGGKKR